ncbi:hypothetical protein BC936DRAFT_139511 [Jimgerdemannia flammicorona]|uniref:Uncharacterized protein n=1 Tax=Jimgerdemannia flammicorona TaxID=994334 RepID=A0A433B9S6_9FUNG|nr:hypothetical protein BC936DRAFT_139511 [Jimgerdemannia flammicorona]
MASARDRCRYGDRTEGGCVTGICANLGPLCCGSYKGDQEPAKATKHRLLPLHCSSSEDLHLGQHNNKDLSIRNKLLSSHLFRHLSLPTTLPPKHPHTPQMATFAASVPQISFQHTFGPHPNEANATDSSMAAAYMSNMMDMWPTGTAVLDFDGERVELPRYALRRRNAVVETCAEAPRLLSCDA